MHQAAIDIAAHPLLVLVAVLLMALGVMLLARLHVLLCDLALRSDVMRRVMDKRVEVRAAELAQRRWPDHAGGAH